MGYTVTDEMADKTRKARLRGAALATTPTWKRGVREWCAKEGVSLAELGRRVDLDQSSMSRLINGPQATSRAAKAIADITGVRLHSPTGDDAEAQWNELGDQLRREKPEEYQRLVGLLEAITKRS